MLFSNFTILPEFFGLQNFEILIQILESQIFNFSMFERKDFFLLFGILDLFLHFLPLLVHLLGHFSFFLCNIPDICINFLFFFHFFLCVILGYSNRLFFLFFLIFDNVPLLEEIGFPNCVFFVFLFFSKRFDVGHASCVLTHFLRLHLTHHNTIAESSIQLIFNVLKFKRNRVNSLFTPVWLLSFRHLGFFIWKLIIFLLKSCIIIPER